MPIAWADVIAHTILSGRSTQLPIDLRFAFPIIAVGTGTFGHIPMERESDISRATAVGMTVWAFTGRSRSNCASDLRSDGSHRQ